MHAAVTVAQTTSPLEESTMSIKEFKNGYTTFEKLFPSGYYLVQVYVGTELRDKIRCDDYRMAREYLRAFNAIAKAA
jgi:hypothetical protein